MSSITIPLLSLEVVVAETALSIVFDPTIRILGFFWANQELAVFSSTYSQPPRRISVEYTQLADRRDDRERNTNGGDLFGFRNAAPQIESQSRGGCHQCEDQPLPAKRFGDAAYQRCIFIRRDAEHEVVVNH